MHDLNLKTIKISLFVDKLNTHMLKSAVGGL